MIQEETQPVYKNALTGFIPGAFLFMAFLLGLPLALGPNRLERIRHISWSVFVMELVLLATGFAFMTLALGPPHLARQRWRNVLAGVGAVLLLLILSAFLQAAGLVTIILASISAGMLSVLFVWSKRPHV